MTSAYLLAADYATYGVPNATQAQVQQASALIDAYLKRPEGCIYTLDCNGSPCCMAGMSPILSLTSNSTISSGTSIVASYTGSNLGKEHIGDTVVLDRENSDSIETCIISAIAPGAITLAKVQTNHAIGATMDLGLTIYEQKDLPTNRSIAQVSRFPAITLLSGLGRYGYGRRSDQVKGQFAEFNLMSTVQSFGGPPQWILFDSTQADIASSTGELWLPAGLLLSYFSEIRLRYVAGWTTSNLPGEIKQACAMIIQAQANYPILGSIRSIRAGDSQIQFTSSSTLSDDVKSLLAPYRARIFN